MPDTTQNETTNSSNTNNTSNSSCNTVHTVQTVTTQNVTSSNSGGIDSSNAYALNSDVETSDKSTPKPVQTESTPAKSTCQQHKVPEKQMVASSQEPSTMDKVKSSAHDAANKGAGTFVNMMHDRDDRDIPQVDILELLRAMRVPLILALIYYLSPIDLVVDEIPGVGMLDDMGVAMLIFQMSFKKKYKELTGLDLTMAEMVKGRSMITALISNIAGSFVHLLDFSGAGLLLTIPVSGGIAFITFKSLIGAACKGQKVTMKDFFKAMFTNAKTTSKTAASSGSTKQVALKKDYL
jgi:hypothetical protein